MIKRVVIESPYAGRCALKLPWPLRWIAWIVKFIDRIQNIRYVRALLRDSLLRGEAPFASHALYTLRGVLRDDVPTERKIGMEAGFAWGVVIEKRVIGVDRGLTPGMNAGIMRARSISQKIEYRSLPGWRKSGVPVELPDADEAEKKAKGRRSSQRPSLIDVDDL